MAPLPSLLYSSSDGAVTAGAASPAAGAAGAAGLGAGSEASASAAVVHNAAIKSVGRTCPIVTREGSAVDFERPQPGGPVGRVEDAVGRIEGHLERPAAELGTAGVVAPARRVGLERGDEAGPEHRRGVEPR